MTPSQTTQHAVLSLDTGLISLATVMVGTYNHRLVVLSLIIAVLSSYAALDLAGRVTSARGRARYLWLSGGALAMAIGIWSVHYLGMLAFELPVPVRYDWPTVALSFLAAILASVIALFVLSQTTMGVMRTLLGSVFMGGAVASMHYVGMSAPQRSFTVARWWQQYYNYLITISLNILNS